MPIRQGGKLAISGRNWSRGALALDQFGLPAFIHSVGYKNILGKVYADGDNAHVFPFRDLDENDAFHLGTFDAVRGNFAAFSGRGSPFHSLDL